MKYRKIVTGQFLSRPNRFIANVNIGGVTQAVHVKNTGRCRELLIPQCRVYLEESDKPSRSTKFDLVAVEKVGADGSVLLINMDSQAPNRVAVQWLRNCGLFSPDAEIFSERVYGNSRFDFYVEDGGRKAFIEVKGVTLEEDGIAYFPDAPTLRGVKHINGLVECVRDGYEAYLLFVIQMKGVREFRPNDKTHREFGDALRFARKSGVKLIAMSCVVTEDGLKIDSPVEIKL